MNLQYDPNTGPFPPVDPDTNIEASDASYVDDDLFFNMTDSADGAVSCLRRMAEIVYEVFWLHGLSVNFDPGKTEGALRLCGVGSAKARRAIAEGGGIPLRLADGRSVTLVVGHAYKHMGGLHAARTSHAART